MMAVLVGLGQNQVGKLPLIPASRAASLVTK